MKNDILDTLFKAAQANENMPKAKIAAAITKGNQILGMGFNSLKSDPLQAKYSKNEHSIFLHAEIHAIKNSIRNYGVDALKNSTIHVCRVKKPNSKSDKYINGLAKPCAGCRKAIEAFNLRYIRYTLDNHDTMIEEV